MNSNERARAAYDSFRMGLRTRQKEIPHWEDAPSWLRDIALAAYLQGKLDGLTQQLKELP